MSTLKFIPLALVCAVLSGCSVQDEIASAENVEAVIPDKAPAELRIETELASTAGDNVIPELAKLLRSIRARLGSDRQWSDKTGLLISVRYRQPGAASPEPLLQLYSRRDRYVAVAADAPDAAILSAFDDIDWGTESGFKTLSAACSRGGPGSFCLHQYDNW
jgi:hypothetical protein